MVARGRSGGHEHERREQRGAGFVEPADTISNVP